MTWRTHAACGVASLWCVAALPASAFPSANFGLLAAVAALGALLPDLDAPVSKLSAWSLGGIRPLYPVARAVSARLGHRGPLHSWPGLVFAAAMGTALAVFLGALAGVSLWLGYASHLAADACTVSGIPLSPGRRRLWLLPPRLRIVTGSPPEDIVFAAASSLALWLLVAHLGLAQQPTN